MQNKPTGATIRTPPLKPKTMKTKHTQGEWNVNDDKIQINIGELTYTPNKDSFYGNEMKEAQANAKLIASTPEMLAALNKAFVLLQKSYNTGEKPNYIDLREIENTIKKATN